MAFSCKGRGFCPSCTGRRMNATAANLTELPRRSPPRGPPYWKSRVLRRQPLGDEDDGQGRWVPQTA